MSTMERLPEPPPEVLLPPFPNEIALNILARVPRRYHPVLSALSKPIRSAVSSPHFFALRSLLNRTESILYLGVGSYCHENLFTVHRNPNPTEDNFLQQAPATRFPVETKLYAPGYAAVGPKIYILGGSTLCMDGKSRKTESSSDVWVLECCSHTWERGPSMLTPRGGPRVMVMDGKIYAVGGYPENLWVEVLDPAVGRWEAIPCPLDGIDENVISFVEVVDGKISIYCKRFMVSAMEFRLDPTKKTWEVLHDVQWQRTPPSCVVDGVSYDCSGWLFRRFDQETGVFEELKGVGEGKPEYACGPQLLNLEGRLFMAFAEMRFGDTDSSEKGKLGVWCAEIDVTNDGDGDWCGRVRWSDKIQLLPERTWHCPEENFVDTLPPYFCNLLPVSL